MSHRRSGAVAMTTIKGRRGELKRGRVVAIAGRSSKLLLEEVVFVYKYLFLLALPTGFEPVF